MDTFDSIVIGIGAMGSAVCHRLAERGQKVVGLEQHAIAHDLGSSHGHSRVIRKAYFEDPRYVPLLHRTYAMWRELEQTTGATLLHLVGCLNLGPTDHICVKGARKSAEEHGLPHEVLDRDEVENRWPVIKANPGDVGIYEDDGGFVVPEQCIQVQVAEARRLGATIQEHHHVLSWKSTNSGVRVESNNGNFEAKQLFITAGPWLAGELADLSIPLKIERQVQLWFAPEDPAPFRVGRLPVFIHFVDEAAYYAIPMRAREGLKAARHHAGEATTVEAVNRNITEGDEADIRGYLAKQVPKANGKRAHGTVCMYTNTPDDHFIIDRHPRHQNVFIAGGFSGHGFKFAPVVGEILAELAIAGKTNHPIEFFSITRFE